jgi:hypothetical protein
MADEEAAKSDSAHHDDFLQRTAPLASWAGVIVAALAAIFNHVPVPDQNREDRVPLPREDQQHPVPDFPGYHNPGAPPHKITPHMVDVAANSQEHRSDVAGLVREHYFNLNSTFENGLDLDQAADALVDPNTADHHRAFAAILLGALGHVDAAPDLQQVASGEGAPFPVAAAHVGLQMLREHVPAVPTLAPQPRTETKS